jgi:hypothetical protein
MVNQNVQEALKKFHVNQNKEYEKTQKQIKEIIGTLNKKQNEVPPKVKSWRHAGDTPYRQNHQEETKL